MIRERIADDIYVFTSQRYARVTAGAVLTQAGVVLIDTLFYPDETRALKTFIEERLELRVRYLINTHYHADHTLGNYLFPHVSIVGHVQCRELMDTLGREGLAQAQAQQSEFEAVEIVLPDILLEEGVLDVYIGDKLLQLHHLPGHSPDLVGVYVHNDGILFASDNAMPVPTLFDGAYADLVDSLHAIMALQPDCVVRGHGEVILRGEVEKALQADLDYLRQIRAKVERTIARGGGPAELEKIDIESCGKSRLPLNGLVTDLHAANVRKLYQELQKSTPG